jgi:2-oxoglutarate ferredoxin oxidoreductase subunit alpha
MGPAFGKKDISIVLCGEAGQGIQTVEQILVWAFKLAGYNVFACKEYMSRVRGGTNSTLIRVSSVPVKSYIKRIDLLVVLSKDAQAHLKKRINTETLIIGDQELIKKDHNKIPFPFIDMSKEIGGVIYSNIIAAGLVSKVLGVDFEIFKHCLEAMFSRKGDEVLNNDILAGEKGYILGEEFMNLVNLDISIPPNEDIKDHVLLNGSEAVGLGCIAGGLRFMSSYPMTPSTPLQSFIARQAPQFDIVFEQAEDEIAAINMALGASYAGARSLVATSGSGFALMEEAVGLSGMIETPVVVYIGMRPGPAVGLPTRTAQEDLDLVLYSGPGEFSRVIYAPGKLEDAYIIGQKAFDISEKYQIPVFILSDQYFADQYYNLSSNDLVDEDTIEYIIPTTTDYLRYDLRRGNVSPRGIPGYGKGLVVVDADDHDQKGHLTEDLHLRKLMVEKRFNKFEKIKEEAMPPELYGNDQYNVLAIGWGSTYGPLKEAIDRLPVDNVAFLHFQQVYPLAPNLLDFLERAKKTVIFENNIKGQFANLIKLETGFDIDEKVLKYDGLPFSVEDICSKLGGMI